MPLIAKDSGPPHYIARVIESLNDLMTRAIMKKSDARKAKRIVAENQDYLIQKWRELHG
jgi:hypothetical protein